MQRTVLAILAFCALGWAAPVGATTALVNGSGQLTGVADLPVLGSLYNVSLVEGSCASLFGGCDDSGDFDFNSDVIAMFAAQALLDHIPGAPFGPFHDDPSLIFGC